MDPLLAKFRRGRHLALVLGLLLFGSELVHLCYHEHLHRPTAEPSRLADRKPNGAPGLSADLRHFAKADAEEFFCPCCSSVIDLLCSPVSAEPQADALPTFAVRCDLAPPAFSVSLRHQPRAPPRG